MYVIIGLPIYNRAWILPHWFKAIENQDFPLEDLGFIFMTGPNDMSTLHELLRFHASHPEIRCFDILLDTDEIHESHLDVHRHWKRHRYTAMSNFRNKILDQVTARNPDRFFSLDSDVLIPDPTTISQLVELTETRDAVSPLLFMTPEGDQFPNVMTWFHQVGDRAFRKPDYPLGTLFKSDIIMAAVMMNQSCFSTARYSYDPQGEDLGWSVQCAREGLELYSASYLYTPHIMGESALIRYLNTGDQRAQPFKELG